MGVGGFRFFLLFVFVVVIVGRVVGIVFRVDFGFLILVSGRCELEFIKREVVLFTVVVIVLSYVGLSLGRAGGSGG